MEFNTKLDDCLFRTPDGKIIFKNDMTHQQLSNVHWYNLYVCRQFEEMKFGDSVLGCCIGEKDNTILLITHKDAKRDFSFAESQLKNRFNNVILDWIPEYKNEFSWFAKWNTRKTLIEKLKRHNV